MPNIFSLFKFKDKFGTDIEEKVKYNLIADKPTSLVGYYCFAYLHSLISTVGTNFPTGSFAVTEKDIKNVHRTMNDFGVLGIHEFSYLPIVCHYLWRDKLAELRAKNKKQRFLILFDKQSKHFVFFWLSFSFRKARVKPSFQVLSLDTLKKDIATANACQTDNALGIIKEGNLLLSAIE
jgi:hypothetical protein